jgi:RNA polymerase sigma-70 factor (ECF subfamily)
MTIAACRPYRPGRDRRIENSTSSRASAMVNRFHVETPTFDETNWPQIRHLHDELLLVWPSPVALSEVEALEHDERLASYHYLYAIKAVLLSRLGRTGEANHEYRRAVELSMNEAERKFINSRIVD